MNTGHEGLDCGFPQVGALLDDCLAEARDTLSPQGLRDYVEAGRFLGKMGRGAEPLLIFLQEWPRIATMLGEAALVPILDAVRAMTRSPNGKAIAPFLQSLAGVARRLPAAAQMRYFLELSLDLMARTSGSIHGKHQTFASPCLADFFRQAPRLLGLLSVEGLRNWVDYGVRNYRHHPQRQCDYFNLQCADSRAVLQRERHGTLLADHLRPLELYLRGLWDGAAQCVPYSTGFDELRQPVPHVDAQGMHLPDVYDARHGVTGLDRYRVALAHMAAHQRWSRPLVADNYSPFQRLAIEFFEDARVDALLLRRYPGMRPLFTALHPSPREGACATATQSCLRHRLAMLSRALLDPCHGYANADVIDFARRFHALLAHGESSTDAIAHLALRYVAQTRVQSDALPTIDFTDTEIDYRDDNRHLWCFHERDDADAPFKDRPAQTAEQDTAALPPRHYPEWDYSSQAYRPDWVCLYERAHPTANPAHIDALLAKHQALAKQLQRMLALLKPQDKVRERHQEEGSELDLDVAIRAWTDFRSGHHPDPRINMRHTTDGRSIAVLLLLDLSASLNEKVAGTDQSILALSQEAVSLLAWSVEQLGDPFAIAGFHSNTRFDVRYLHIKGFGEPWSKDVKGRLAALEAGYSTRMGAAMRHAAHCLEGQKTDKKLLLVLTDGQPSDIDVPDARLLIEDARQSVRELDQKGIFSYCINLDPKADAYVGDIFGHQYTVIDRVARLPEQLPRLFMALTR